MIDMLKWHEIQVLRRARHPQIEVATLAGVSLGSVRRVEREAAVTHIDTAGERRRRAIGRPSTAEPFRSVIAEIVAREPDLLSDLLVAQKQLALLDASVRNPQVPRRVASTAPIAVTVSASKTDTPDSKELPAISERATALTASLNTLLGWPAETPLELEPPAPLVEHLSLHEALDQALTTNPEVIEAEQTVRKAEAAAKVSKLAYIPDFAVFGGYAYESNVIPLLPIDFSYIGVMGTYNLFDSGKREHTVTQRTVQVRMAQTALELTKAKVAAAVQESYAELERSRALAAIAHRLEAVTYRAAVTDSTDDVDTQMASARLSLELLQLDFHHRHALAKLEAIMASSTR